MGILKRMSGSGGIFLSLFLTFITADTTERSMACTTLQGAVMVPNECGVPRVVGYFSVGCGGGWWVVVGRSDRLSLSDLEGLMSPHH